MASGPTFNQQRGFWYVQYHDGAKSRRVKVASGPPRWQPGDPPPKSPPPEAKAAFARWQTIEDAVMASRGKNLPTDLAEWLNGHVASYPKESTRCIVRLAVDQFLAWCQAEKFTRFDQIDKAACSRFLRATVVPSSGASKAPSRDTMKTRRAYLAAAWGRLVNDEVIIKSPWEGTRAHGEVRVKPKNAWTIDQYRRLLDHAEPWLRRVLIVGVNTGLRIEALMALEWRDWIHPEPGERHFGCIHVREEVSKTGEYRVPVSEELHDMLIRWLTSRDHDPVFILTALRGGTLKYSTQTSKAIVKTCALAGLPKPGSPNHHMRRTFGRLAIRGQLTGQPVPLFVVSRWLGHAQVKTTMIYLDLEEIESTKFMLPTLTPLDRETPPSATHPIA